MKKILIIITALISLLLLATTQPSLAQSVSTVTITYKYANKYILVDDTFRLVAAEEVPMTFILRSDSKELTLVSQTDTLNLPIMDFEKLGNEYRFLCKNIHDDVDIIYSFDSPYSQLYFIDDKVKYFFYNED